MTINEEQEGSITDMIDQLLSQGNNLESVYDYIDSDDKQREVFSFLRENYGNYKPTFLYLDNISLSPYTIKSKLYHYKSHLDYVMDYLMYLGQKLKGGEGSIMGMASRVLGRSRSKPFADEIQRASLYDISPEQM